MTERLEPVLQHDPAELRAEPRPVPPSESLPRRPLRWGLWVLLALFVLPVLPVLAMRWLPPPTTAFMLQSPTQPVRYQWVPASKISEHARRAVVAAEDQKFWNHQGFDLEAIEKAYAHNQRSKRRRGASTITQQTAKNLFLWSGGGYFRKAVEAGYTVLLEKLWSKQRILEVYLNVAEFGPGIYGVEAASRAYFNKSAAQLSPNEAARLAAILPSPRRWSVQRPGAYVQKRVSWVMRQMGYGPRPAEDDEPELPAEVLESMDSADSPAAQAPALEAEPASPVVDEPAPAESPTPASESEPAAVPEAEPQPSVETAPQ